MTDRLARAFLEAPEFASSPLYTALGATVAGSEALLRLAGRARAGQYPTFLFFGAVHYLLLRGAGHELAAYYPSVVADGDPVLPADRAGPALEDFCAAFETELASLIESRLVQTNNVKRSLALRYGLAAIARRVGTPVRLVEVGTSAGIHLRSDRYGYVLGGRQFGDPHSPVRIGARWHGTTPVPDLDLLPPLAGAAGIDLNPVNPADPDARLWLEALVFPENRHQAGLLRRALAVVAADPPDIRAGDAVDLCPELAAELPPGQVRVVFHAATRLHVPQARRAAFDAGIDTLGENAPLYRLTLEDPPDPDPRPRPARRGVALSLRDPSGASTDLAVMDGHLEWIEPLGH